MKMFHQCEKRVVTQKPLPMREFMIKCVFTAPSV